MKSANREFQGYTPVVHLQRWSALSFQNKELLSATYALVPPFLWGAHCPCGDNHRFYHYHLLLIYIFINYIADKKEWSGVPVPHPQQIGRLPELSDVLCPQCKSCRAFDKLICFEQYYMRLNRTKMIFMYTMFTTHTCDQLSKKCCVYSKEKLNKFLLHGLLIKTMQIFCKFVKSTKVLRIVSFVQHSYAMLKVLVCANPIVLYFVTDKVILPNIHSQQNI